MKAITIVIIFFSLISCNSQNNKKRIVESFTENILIKDNINFNLTKKYINYKKEYLKDQSFKKLSINLIQNLHYQLKKNDFKYSILTSEELKKLNLNYSFNYNKYKNVFHLISSKEVLTSFIIKDNKIISFSYNIIKKQNQTRTPFILN